MKTNYYFRTENGRTKEYDLTNDSERLNAYFELRRLRDEGEMGEAKFLQYIGILKRNGLRLTTVKDSDDARELKCESDLIGRYDNQIPDKAIDRLLDDLNL